MLVFPALHMQSVADSGGSAAEKDRRMLVDGLHDLIQKGLLHPPEEVLSALRNLTKIPEGDSGRTEGRKSFDKLVRAVIKVLRRLRFLFLPPSCSFPP